MIYQSTRDSLEYGNQKVKEQDVAHNEVTCTQDVDQPVFLLAFHLGHIVRHPCHGWAAEIPQRLETILVRWETKIYETNLLCSDWQITYNALIILLQLLLRSKRWRRHYSPIIVAICFKSPFLFKVHWLSYERDHSCITLPEIKNRLVSLIKILMQQLMKMKRAVMSLVTCNG